ncbi:PTS system fructose family transporter subunit IIA [Spirochaetia bacterium]|nr:PTS system fructose family transporter subunit IIA [Spirochaetia bacterium]
MVSFKQIFSEDSAAVDIPAADKAGALAAAVDVLARNGKVGMPQKLLVEIKARESLASTGIGFGVSVPHVLCDEVDEIMGAVLRLKEGVDFNAEDSRPVDLMFLIAGPKGETFTHLKLLSKLARLLHDAAFRESLRQAPDGKALAALLYEKD